jgi:hypothetical protein
MGEHTIDWTVLQQTVDQLTPSEKLQLIEEVARSLRADTTPADAGACRETLETLRRQLAAIPVRNPADGFSNRDHDTALYGDRQ